MPPQSAFIAPLLPPSRILRRPHAAPRCAASPTPPYDPHAAPTPSDQFTQYAARDKAALAAEAARLAESRALQRHHHVFLHTPAEGAFRAAADRYVATFPPDAARLWILRTTADPTFGSLRGEPVPARAVLLEDLTDRGETLTSRWVAALDRAGKALSPMESHFVDWAVCQKSAREGVNRDILPDVAVVSFEVLNADWANAQSVPKMKEKLMRHAERVVTEGNANLYEVMQSVSEPTCFKTVELYPTLDALEEHMKTLDPPFAKDMMECRAAVNRVRQLYKPLISLNS